MVENLRKRRTQVNFDKHILTEIKHDDIVIYKFAIPETRCKAITFINAEGVLAVTGDYGNWIFCREFHISDDGYVSDGYWCEKLRICSTQKTSDHDSDGTRDEIQERLKEEDLEDDEKEYLESLLDYVYESEERYLVYAHDNLPQHRDHEFVPHVKKMNEWLEVIFDAFEEMCARRNSINIVKV